MSLSCVTVADCPFLYDCIALECVHKPIFPLSVYTGFVYFLLTIGVMLTNVGGVSAGIYKIPILMDMLNYSVDQANYLSYPIVTGASLANFILLIPKRHQTRCTSLVDYNLVLILIPSVIFGSTIGVIVVKLIPIIYQDSLLIIIFVLFTIFFVKEIRQVKVQTGVKEVEPLLTPAEIQLTQRQNEGNTETSSLVVEAEKSMNQNREGSGGQADVKLDYQYELSAHLDYEKTYHWKDIILSFVVFVMFEVLSLICQGKLFFDYGICTWMFGLSFTILCLIVIGYMAFIYHIIVKRLRYYRRIKYQYDLKLDHFRNFGIVLMGGFIGGFLQGIIGDGSGSAMVAAMLLVGAEPDVTSATSGYQIVFVGAASMIQALANKELSWLDVAWLFSICFVVGGILTIVFYRLMEGRPSVPRILLIIIAVLCLIGAVGTIPSIVLTHKYYGWNYMLSVQGFCS